MFAPARGAPSATISNLSPPAVPLFYLSKRPSAASRGTSREQQHQPLERPMSREDSRSMAGTTESHRTRPLALQTKLAAVRSASHPDALPVSACSRPQPPWTGLSACPQAGVGRPHQPLGFTGPTGRRILEPLVPVLVSTRPSLCSSSPCPVHTTRARPGLDHPPPQPTSELRRQ